MHRFAISLAAVVVLVWSVFVMMSRGTAAQDDLTAEPAIVGAWEWDNNPSNPGTELSYAIFHDDGTYLEINTDGSINIGAWKPTGERTAAVTARTQFIEEGSNETIRGTLLLDAEIDATGNQITAPWTFEARNTDGKVIFAGQFRSIGTRIYVMPMVPLGTPSAATPIS